MGLHKTQKLLHSKGNDQQEQPNRDNLLNRRYLQIIYLKRSDYPKYIENAYN